MDDKDKSVLEKTITDYKLPNTYHAENGGRIAKVWWQSPLPEVYISGSRWTAEKLTMIKTNGYLHGLTVNLDNGIILSAIVTTEKKENTGGNIAYFKRINELAFHENACGLEKLAEN